MTRSALVLGAIVVVAGCASTPNRAVSSDQARVVAAGDLPPAAPLPSESSDRGEAGVSSRVVLGGRRDRVSDLYQRFLRVLMNHDIAGLGALLDQSVGDLTDGGDTRSRDQILAEYEPWMAHLDLSALALVIPSLRPVVRSAAEFRRQSRQVPAGMRSDDWLIEAPTRPQLASLPRQLLVRWVGDEPVIAALPRVRRY